jgi:heme-degrading monooxygenase HmoA
LITETYTPYSIFSKKKKNMIANTPKPPYYAVIFSSTRTQGDQGYADMADLMVELAAQQEGFLGLESARNELGITVSYWKDLDSIKKWREHTEHTVARNKGRSDWYQRFKTRIAKVERDYGFEREESE